MKINLQDLVDKHWGVWENSVVIDVGGYDGEYAQKMYDRYKPWIAIYEPNPQKAHKLFQRFKDNTKVILVFAAIGKTPGKRRLYLREDGSSFWKEWAKTTNSVDVRVMCLSDIVRDEQIAVLKLNCEGAEYEILEDLAENNQLENINEILVQFHQIPGYKERYRWAQETLAKTHEKVHDYKWELWRKVFKGLKSEAGKSRSQATQPSTLMQRISQTLWGIFGRWLSKIWKKSVPTTSSSTLGGMRRPPSLGNGTLGWRQVGN